MVEQTEGSLKIQEDLIKGNLREFDGRIEESPTYQRCHV